jgi:hypothetical protein
MWHETFIGIKGNVFAVSLAGRADVQTFTERYERSLEAEASTAFHDAKSNGAPIAILLRQALGIFGRDLLKDLLDI